MVPPASFSSAPRIDYSTTKGEWIISRRSRAPDQRQICVRRPLTVAVRTAKCPWRQLDPTDRPRAAARRLRVVAKARVIRKSNLRNRIFGRDRRAGYEYN